MDLLNVAIKIQEAISNIAFDIEYDDGQVHLQAFVDIDNLSIAVDISIMLCTYFGSFLVYFNAMDEINYENLNAVNEYNEKYAHFFRATITEYGSNEFCLLLEARFETTHLENEQDYADLVCLYFEEIISESFSDNIQDLLKVRYKEGLS